MKFVLKFLPVLTAFLIWGCSSERSAGGAGSETNSGLTAQVISIDGKPLAKATCQIRPSWYTRTDSLQSAWDRLPAPQYANGTTDKEGYLNLPMLAPGTYLLDIQHTQTGALIRVDVKPGDTLISLGEVSLAQLGQVRGHIVLPNQQSARVQVYGTERVVWTDTSGNFVIHDLPPGLRVLRIDEAQTGKMITELQLNESDTIQVLDSILINQNVIDATTWSVSIDLPLSLALRDSAFEANAAWTGLELPLLFPISSSTVNFKVAAPDGSDIVVIDTQGQIVPMQIRYWDPVKASGLLWIRNATQGMKLLYGKAGATTLQNPSAVWLGWSDSLKQELTHIRIDDFEDNDTLSTLLSHWYRGVSTYGQLLQPAYGNPISSALKQDTTGRSLYSMQVRYVANGSSDWVLVASKLSEKTRDLRKLDSLVFWARGNGNIYVALENLEVTPIIKTWKIMPIESTWRRYCIRPNDFDPPGDGDNVGWPAMQSAITTLSFFGQGGSEYWIDDIEMFGIHPLELR